MSRSILSVFLIAATSLLVKAQRSNDIGQALQCSVQYPVENSMLITWLPKNDATEYNVDYRQDLGSPYTRGGTTTDTFFVLSGLDIHTPTEIRVTKQGGQSATGYISASYEYLAPPTDRRLLLIVEASIYDSLQATIASYQDVLLAERWRTEVVTVADSLPVDQVKERIVAEHAQDPLDAVLLLGHVPVPYAGNNAIDGHSPDHMGAWAADVYYGDLTGQWTDNFVNNTGANRDANDNVPGDGKFDQNAIPGEVTLAIGRVDMSDLPAFSESEIELTRAYLRKNIAYRTGQFKATRRAIVDNNFNIQEGFAQGAIKSFSGFFDVDSIDYGAYSQAYQQDYLWTYGAGGGNYRGASGITNTNGLAADSLQTVFTNLFGSYFGDWDTQNNFLRSALASGTTLINAWSGRPVWHWHLMATGATVGDVVRMVQNDNGRYTSQFGRRLTHIALMGDPTLKMYYEPPVDQLSAVAAATSVELEWSYDTSAVGFLVYQLDEMGLATRLTDSVVSARSYTIDCPDAGQQRYLVLPLTIELSPSGSYYNEGAGAILTINVPAEEVRAGINSIDDGNTILLDSDSENATSFAWDFGDGNTTDVENPGSHTYDEAGDYTITLIASNGCMSDTVSIFVSITFTMIATNILSTANVYPNPVQGGYLTISLPNTHSYTYRLLDIRGRICRSGKSTGTTIVNVTELPRGMYLVELLSPDIGAVHRSPVVIVQ